MKLFQSIKYRLTLYWKFYRNWVLIVCAALTILFLSAFMIQGRGPDTLVVEFPQAKYGMVRSSHGLNLREKPTTRSERTHVFPNGAVLKLEGEAVVVTDRGTKRLHKWYRVRGHGGRTGWCFGKYIRIVSKYKGRRQMRKYQNAFEVKLKKKIVNAVARYIKQTRIRSGSRIVDIRIISSLKPQASSTYKVRTVTYMVGNFLGINRYLIDTEVNLNLDILPNRLSRSSIKVNHVDFLAERQAQGITPLESVSLLKDIIDPF